jgi:hypothetical protein
MRDFGRDDAFVEGLNGVCERCQMMNIYVIVFFLLPFVGMIGAVVVLARERRVRSHQRH